MPCGQKKIVTYPLSKLIYIKNTLTFPMGFRKSDLYVFAILVVINGMTGGTVLDHMIIP